MVPATSRRRLLAGSGIAVVLVGLFLLPASPLSVTGNNAETPELTVSSLERIDSGCADDVATFASSQSGGGEYTKVSFIETGSKSANLTARTERTSPVGADLTTFRVYVDSAGTTEQNTSCSMGVQYRLELDYDRAQSGGILSGDDGTRVLWLENGRYTGCSSTTSGSLDAECGRFLDGDTTERIWANSTTG
jgi:hypothetical protein